MKSVAVVLTASLVIAGGHAARGADVLYVKGARLILDVTKPPVSNGAVVITDGVVTAAGQDIPVPDGARQIDAGPLTLMPSLIDSHIHMDGGRPVPQPGQPMPIASPAYAALHSQKTVERALSLGVAAVRDMASEDFVDVAIAQAIDDGTIAGPHVIPAAHALSIVGGHEDFTPLPYTVDLRNVYDPLHGFVGSPADVEKAVQLQIKYGARVIKLMASGGVGSPLDSLADPNLTFEEMRVAVEQAHMHHLKVAAHAENLRSVMDALKAGVDSIEHGSELDQEAVDYMKSHNVVYVPTLHVVVTGLANSTPKPGTAQTYSQFKAQLQARTHFAAFALALKNGVTMAAGSDTAYPSSGAGVIGEVVTDVEYGMSPRQALEAVTLHGAALLGLDKLGTLGPGMEGDLIAVDGDPLANIHAMERVQLVVFKGRIVSDRIGRPLAGSR